MSTLEPDAHQRLADVDKVLRGKVVLAREHHAHLAYLLQALAYLIAVGKHAHLIDTLHAQFRQAAPLKHRANLVEAHLRLVIIWVYHYYLTYYLIINALSYCKITKNGVRGKNTSSYICGCQRDCLILHSLKRSPPGPYPYGM